MAERTAGIRGTRLGGPRSFEDEDASTFFEPRSTHTYQCTLGHETSVPFHRDAEVPTFWSCGTCPAEAVHSDRTGAPAAVTKTGSKSHWEQLQSRRTTEELEALLKQALKNYRTTGKSF